MRNLNTTSVIPGPPPGSGRRPARGQASAEPGTQSCGPESGFRVRCFAAPRNDNAQTLGKAIKTIAAIVSLAALAACATPNDAGAAPKETRAFNAIAAPTRDDVAREITGADNGTTVAVKAGTTISVALSGIPTAGYLWSVVEAPSFLEAAGEDSGPTSEAQLQPGFSGGRHWEVFYFRVTGEGEGVLRLEQRRPWEDDEPPADEFSVAIVAAAE
jgi:predicted secreted protein